MAVFVDHNVEVPMEFVKNNEIILNLSLEACHQLNLDNDWISFQARFGGVPKKIMVPVSHVLAIYARENGQGMSFPFEPRTATVMQTCDNLVEVKKPSLRLVKNK
jgi:stringent starvation protein B